MKSERGFSVLETQIAMMIFGIITVAVLGGLGATSKALFSTDRLQSSKNLALAQMEYVKSQPFAMTYTPSTSLTSEYSGYSTAIYASNLPGGDANIQEIKIVVSHQGTPVTTEAGSTLVDYKVNR
jgi:type II secretory pathway pseudopilin PulG